MTVIMPGTLVANLVTMKLAVVERITFAADNTTPVEYQLIVYDDDQHTVDTCSHVRLIQQYATLKQLSENYNVHYHDESNSSVD